MNFLKELETDSEDLTKLILDADWRDSNTRYSLKNSINEKFQKVRNHISRYEIEETEIREAIIASSLKDLSVWKAYLSWESINNECSFGIHQKKVIRELPKPKGILELLPRLIKSKGFLDFSFLSKLFKNHPEQYLDSLLGFGDPENLSFEVTIRRFGPHIEENPERAVEWLLRISSYGILESSIDHQTLMRAPRRFRKALLLDPSCRFLFEKELKRSLQESPEEIDGSPAAIRLNELRESVLRSLTHDSYSDREISEWLDHPKIMLRSSKSIIASLKKQTNPYYGPDYLSESSISKLRELSNEPVFFSLLYCGIEPTRRLILLEDCDESMLNKTCLNIQPEFHRRMLLSLSNYRECRKAIRILERIGILNMVVSKGFIKEMRGKGSIIERYLFLFGKNLRNSIRIRATPENILDLLRGSKKEGRILKELFDRFSEADRMPYWNSWYATKEQKIKKYAFEDDEHAESCLENHRFLRLLRGGPVHRRILREAITTLRNSENSIWMDRHLVKILEIAPNYIVSEFRCQLNQDEWKIIFGREDFWRRVPEADSMLRNHLDPSSLSSGEVALKRVLRKRFKENHDLLRWSFMNAPSIFYNDAKKHLDWWERLPFCLSNSSRAWALEKEIGRIESVGAKNFVKSHYPPNISAAMELALVFGLGFGPFLAECSKKLVLDRDDLVQGNEFDHLYETYKIPKKTGGSRLITAPKRKLKEFQRAILDRVGNYWKLEDCVTGFRPGYGLVENAIPHTCRRIVVNVDIKGFFPNTRFDSIIGILKKLLKGRFSPRAIRLMASLCSHDRGLPTGAPSSPAIANQVLLSTDRSISTLAKMKGVNYSRYADDLTFSGDNEETLKMIPFVERILKETGHVLDDKKTNIFRKGRRQCVTGLVVNERPNLARPLRRRIRAAVHHHQQGRPIHWHGKSMSLEQLMGRIGFLALTCPGEAQRYRNSLKKQEIQTPE